MGRKIRLLHKTLLVYSAGALVCLAICMPLYYFIVRQIILEETDEMHLEAKQRIELAFTSEVYAELEPDKIISLLKVLNPGIKLKENPDKIVFQDSFYSIKGIEMDDQEVEPIRGYSTGLGLRGKPWHLSIESNLEEAEESIEILAGIALLFFLLLILALALFIRIFSASLWKPFYSALGALKLFDLNKDKSFDLKDSNILEFHQLNTGLNSIMKENILAFRRQKEFLENFAHELQTPLAMLMSKTDLLLQNNKEDHQTQKNLISIQESISRISRINKNLLLLSRIEQNQFPEKENLILEDSIRYVLDLTEDFFQERACTVNCKFESKIELFANRYLLEILLTNLLSNALRHSEKGIQIIIETKENECMISNPGTTPLNKDAVFQRFISTSIHSPGSGLGLAISREICLASGWVLTYDFINGRHFFTISF